MSFLPLGCSTKNGSDDDIGGETHWLSCTTEDDCKGGRSCVCGLCTSECSADEDCTELGARAECHEAAKTDFEDACETEGVERLCVLPSMVPEADADDDVDGDDDQPSSSGCVGEGADEDPQCASCFTRADSEDDLLGGVAREPRFASCSVDSDCVVVNNSTLCSARCGAVINGEQAAEFEAEVARITGLYCGAPGYTPDCSVDANCAGANPGCEDGVCVRNASSDGSDVFGWLYDASRDCYADRQLAGTASCETADGALAYAQSPNGECWLFSDSCIPDGFAVGGECSNQDVCVEPTTCAGDLVNVNGECLSCDEAADARGALRDAAIAPYALGRCETAADCELVDISLACHPGCSTAVVSSEREQFEGDLMAASDAACTDEAAGCSFPVADCPAVTAACVDEQCVIAEREEFPISGAPYDETLGCFGETQLAGTSSCVDGPPVVVHALSEDGECWMFSSGCLPTGFTALGGSDVHPCAATFDVCEASGDACAPRSLLECESPCVVSRAHAYDVSQACYEVGFEDLACIDDPGGCGEAETLAVDADGVCWLFPSTCLPDGFASPEEGQCAEPTLCEP